jgi:hypothetical protein
MESMQKETRARHPIYRAHKDNSRRSRDKTYCSFCFLHLGVMCIWSHSPAPPENPIVETFTLPRGPCTVS